MELSARNQLNATVAAITRGSAERLGLAEGDQVVVIVKATEVMLAKNWPATALAASLL
jgi:molybdopterin-binding protein